ncbi:MAG: hypothetical protein II809_05520, partial [Bacteroidales bacterium]|nr:hypothetical protein [Bacteroidales bacterium]
MQRCSQPSALAALLVLQVYFHQVGVVVLRRLRQALLGLQLLHRVEVGENGQLFGAINNIQVADALKAQYNYDVDRKKIVVDGSKIKEVGSYTAMVNIYREIKA